MVSTLNRRQLWTGAGAFAAGLAPVAAAFADVCAEVVPRHGFNNAQEAYRTVFNHVVDKADWKHLVDKIATWSDSQASWITTELPNAVNTIIQSNVQDSSAKAAAAVINEDRNTLINYLNGALPNTVVETLFGYDVAITYDRSIPQQYQQRLYARDNGVQYTHDEAEAVVRQAENDPFIPDAVKPIVTEGLRLGSWNYITTELAFVQADLLEQNRLGKAADFLRERAAPIRDIVDCRLRSNGLTPPASRGWQLPTLEL